jgi:uncharacterized protein YgiM (DUF1202 family)
MSIRKLAAASMMLLTVLALGPTTTAWAQYCEGTVHGLSGRYNLAKGTGFLAVRARPNSGSRMVGQLFNGDTVEIFDRRGSWYRVAMGGIDGWAHSRWMHNSCRY